MSVPAVPPTRREPPPRAAGGELRGRLDAADAEGTADALPSAAGRAAVEEVAPHA